MSCFDPVAMFWTMESNGLFPNLKIAFRILLTIPVATVVNRSKLLQIEINEKLSKNSKSFKKIV